MLIRVLATMALALVLEAGVFAVWHRDLLWLRTADVSSPSQREVFVRHAEKALQRPKLTRAQLEAIANRAQRVDAAFVEVRALERITAFGAERGLQLRLADALRRAGQLERAEKMYLALLSDEERLTP